MFSNFLKLSLPLAAAAGAYFYYSERTKTIQKRKDSELFTKVGSVIHTVLNNVKAWENTYKFLQKHKDFREYRQHKIVFGPMAGKEHMKWGKRGVFHMPEKDINQRNENFYYPHVDWEHEQLIDPLRNQSFLRRMEGFKIPEPPEGFGEGCTNHNEWLKYVEGQIIDQLKKQSNDMIFRCYKAMINDLPLIKDHEIKRMLCFGLVELLQIFACNNYLSSSLTDDNEREKYKNVEGGFSNVLSIRSGLLQQAVFNLFAYCFEFTSEPPKFLTIPRLKFLPEDQDTIQKEFLDLINNLDFEKCAEKIAKRPLKLKILFSKNLRFLCKNVQSTEQGLLFRRVILSFAYQILTSHEYEEDDEQFKSPPGIIAREIRRNTLGHVQEINLKVSSQQKEDDEKRLNELSKLVHKEIRPEDNLGRLKNIDKVKPFKLFQIVKDYSDFDKIRRLNEQEIELLDTNSREMYHDFVHLLRLKCQRNYLRQREVNQDNLKIHRYIHRFTRDLISLEKLELNEGNARDFLRVCKIHDWAVSTLAYEGYSFEYAQTTRSIRHRIMSLCPQVKSHEAFMRTLVPGKMRCGYTWINSDNWITDEAANLAKLVFNQVVRSIDLNKRIKSHIQTGLSIGLRGNTCSGKTTYLQNLLLKIFNEVITNKGELNIDTLKAFLRREGGFVNAQVHTQASELLPTLINLIAKYRLSFVLDSRLLTKDKYVDTFIAPTKHLEQCAWLIDFQVPLIASLLRMLCRDKNDESPQTNLSAIIEGYIQLIKNRLSIVRHTLDETAVIKYELIHGSANSYRTIANKTRNGNLEIRDAKKWKKATTTPSKSEIEKKLNTIIDDRLINRFIGNGYINEVEKVKLIQWRGISLREAVFCHVSHLPVSPNLTEIVAFDSSWLSDYPEVLYHVLSERLHIRGTDENWEGYNWPANQFDWKVNPKYNPELNFQMRLGYFWIPFDQIFEAKSSSLNPQVYEEMRTQKGFRFFVHPEAYYYYRNLFNNKFHFVHPKNSEFLGTPTSSYRSWVVRNITNKNSVPFIVKMGVLGAHNDFSKIVTTVDVEKCIRMQEKLQQLPKTDKLIYFPETLGIAAKGIGKNSGLIIREFPESLLKGRVKILSYSALMSAERMTPEYKGLCSLTKAGQTVPLIIEIIATAILQNRVRDAAEFISKYLIHGYLDATENLHMKEGMSYSPHGQNLSLVLDDQNLPAGFAYRDFEGFWEQSEKYIETYSWFYGYHNLLKLLNVLLDDSEEYFYLSRVPIQKADIAKERALNGKYKWGFGINKRQYYDLLNEMDTAYLQRLRKYFDLEKVPGIFEQGFIPSAEPDSIGSEKMIQLNKLLWANRKSFVPT